MDDFIDLVAHASSRSGWRCSWSCSGSTPSASARPSTTRRPATASARDPPPAGLVRARASAHRRRHPVHPPDAAGRSSSSGSGDRLGAVLGGPRSTASVGIAFAVAFATFRYHRIRFPGAWSYPGALLNSIGDRVHRRGRVPRRALRPAARRPGIEPDPRERHPGDRLRAGDAARGARARPLPARPDARDRPRRRLADGRHRRHRRGLPRPRDHPLRGLPVHRPRRPDRSRAAARSRRSRSAAGRPRAGGSSGRGSAVDGSAERRRAVAPGGRRSRSTSTSRSASRSARTATSSSTPGSAARGPDGAGRRVRRRRSRPSSTLRADALDAAVRGEPAAARDRLPRRRDAVAAAGRRSSRGSLERVRGAVRARRRRRGHARGQPGTRRARRPGGLGRRRRDPAVARRPVDGRRAAPAARPAAPGRGRRRRGRARRARPGSARSASTCSTTSPTRASSSWMTTLDAALDLGAGPPLALRADARRPRRRGPDRARRRPPADDRRRAALARDRPAAPGRGPRRGAVPPRGRTGSPTAGCRGYEISNWAQPGPREPAQPRLLGAPAVRGGRARARTRSTASTRRWNAARLDGYLAALDARRRVGAGAAARRGRGGRRRRPRPRSGSSWACGSTPACRSRPRSEPPLADAFGWALAAELVDVTPDDRVVLTTRGRLLSNELFARLV